MTKAIRRYSEGEVLDLLPESRLNQQSENGWPEFNLREVTVFDSRGRMVSALTASKNNLLTFNGNLDMSTALAKAHLS